MATDSITPMASGQDLGDRSRFAKLGMATNDVLNQAYRDILEMEVPPSVIFSKVKASSVYKRLGPEQEQLLIDATHSGYKNFNISLTYTLIRNICKMIPKPTKGKWGEEPAAGEVTVGDDIERIRSIRNNLTANVSSASTPEAEFNDTWSTMSDICTRLETFTGKKYLDQLNLIQKLTIRGETETEDNPIEKTKMRKETGRTRFAKLRMATNDVLNQAYRDILEMEVSPSDIFSKVKASLVYKRLRPEQEHTLLDAKHSGYKNFDISLTYTLIRNICKNIPLPTKGKWGYEPAAGEVTVGDDIERIRSIRNGLTAYVSSASTSQTEFNDTWSTMSDICKRLETFTGKKYLDQLNLIQKLTIRGETETEDNPIEKTQMEELKKLANKEERTSSPTDLDNPKEDLLQHMRTEVTTVRHARGLVVGCAGAGKTTLLYSLMGKSLDEIKEIKSTRGLQVYEHIFTVGDGSLLATENLERKFLVRVPRSLLAKKNGNYNEDADRIEEDNTGDLSDQKEKDNTGNNCKLHDTNHICEENTENIGPEESSINLTSDVKVEDHSTTASDTKVKDTIAETLSPEVIKKILDAQENEISVSMIDFAGQFAYYACHQIYMRSSAFYILVMDMSKSFEEVVFGEEEEDKKGSVFSTWKYKEYVEFWLNSIKSFGGPEAPILIAATHTEGRTEDDIDDYFICLWRSLSEVDKTWLSKHRSEENEFAFELININEGERTQKLQLLKNALVEVVSNKLDTKIPVRSSWALLEHLLQDSGKPIISYEEIQEMNRKFPEQYRLESEEEILYFLTFFHDHGILLYFNGEATRTHAILSLQWFSNAFSRLIADKGHVNKDCKRRHIKEWELFNKTGELKSTLVDAVWKDEKAEIPNEQSYEEYKTELMSYMERLRMLVSIGDTDKIPSWYVPCMNKKPFTKDIIKANLACSSILCFRFTSFAIFVFYRLIAYCMSSLNLKVVPDKRDICLFQTAAVFEYKNHTVLLGICDKDIQVQVVTHSLDIKTEVSCEVGNSIHKALDELTETFENTDLSFQRGYKCQMIFCDQNDTSFTPEEELCKLRIEEIQCSCCPMGEKHLIKVNQTRRFWEQQKMGEDKEGNCHCLDDRLNRPPTDKQLKIVSGHIGADFQLLGIQLGLENATIQQIRMDYQNYGVITQIFQMLCAWKEKEGKQATVKEFLDAIEAHGGEIDIEKIKSVFNL
ncbi:uncharacterized protein LOC134250093 isoform X2 [Saccostrea cucullata]|uniref:uncharacterized protein LOC134250093 isoform X2 n=1 Tax=Saccostrea cuccullata TaxID=36930 RepID=UPI002ED3057B